MKIKRKKQLSSIRLTLEKKFSSPACLRAAAAPSSLILISAFAGKFDLSILKLFHNSFTSRWTICFFFSTWHFVYALKSFSYKDIFHSCFVNGWHSNELLITERVVVCIWRERFCTYLHFECYSISNIHSYCWWCVCWNIAEPGCSAVNMVVWLMVWMSVKGYPVTKFQQDSSRVLKERDNLKAF